MALRKTAPLFGKLKQKMRALRGPRREKPRDWTAFNAIWGSIPPVKKVPLARNPKDWTPEKIRERNATVRVKNWLQAEQMQKMHLAWANRKLGNAA